MKLNDLKIGESAIISKVEASENIKKRFLDIGLIKNSKITKLLESKNMSSYNIKGANIAIRKSDTKDIEVKKWKLV